MMEQKAEVDNLRITVEVDIKKQSKILVQLLTIVKK